MNFKSIAKNIQIITCRRLFMYQFLNKGFPKEFKKPDIRYFDYSSVILFDK
ncbi:hypothetical protein AT05_00880 [Schleiferia thermophila str. Yellowstone]|nr:hypothetical protein AT05_00880 [Schleiferia thermophila str. Yellowstone]